MTETEIAWLAGILEGEGWIGRDDGGRARFELQMTDEDVVARAAALIGRPYLHLGIRKYGKLPTWRVGIGGRPAVDLLRQIRPWMGTRRGARIDDLVAQYDATRECDTEGCAERFPVGAGRAYCSTACAQRARRKGIRIRTGDYRNQYSKLAAVTTVEEQLPLAFAARAKY